MLSIRSCLAWVVAGVLLLPTLATAAQPNILLVMCDDLGWGDVGFNGGKIIKTPHLDAMAQDGLRFTRFYSAAPVCSPTRGSCLTGRHPFRYGIYSANRGHMKKAELTLAELLSEMGYRTGHFGKWHLGTLTKEIKDSNRGGPKNAAHFSPPWINGFSVCFSSEAKVPTYDPMLKPSGQASRNGWDYIRDKSKAEPYGTHYWDHDGQIVRDNLEGDDSRVIVDRLVPFITSAAKDKKPFFGIVWFHTPHLPVVAGPRHVKPYANYNVRARNYYGSVAAMDEQVGRIRKTLAEQGVADNTLILFCSDNGPEGNSKAPGSAGPFRGRKRSLYEGGVRVPGIAVWPSRIKAGQQTSMPTVTSDFFPTIVQLVGARLELNRPIDGISLVNLFDGKQEKRNRAIGFQSAKQLAWNAERYKLYSKDGKTWELYDLQEDRSESKNLASQHPEIVARMKKELEAWRASCRRSDNGKDY